MNISDLETGDRFTTIDGYLMEVVFYIAGEAMLEAKYLDGDLEGDHDLVWEDEINFDTVEKANWQ